MVLVFHHERVPVGCGRRSEVFKVAHVGFVGDKDDIGSYCPGAIPRSRITSVLLVIGAAALTALAAQWEIHLPFTPSR